MSGNNVPSQNERNLFLFFFSFLIFIFNFFVNISEASESKTKQKSLFITSLIHTHSPKSRSSSPILTQYSFYIFIFYFQGSCSLWMFASSFVVFNFLVEEPKIYSLKKYKKRCFFLNFYFLFFFGFII